MKFIGSILRQMLFFSDLFMCLFGLFILFGIYSAICSVSHCTIVSGSVCVYHVKAAVCKVEARQ